MHTLWSTLITLGTSAAGAIVLILAGSGAIAYLATHPPRRRLKRSPDGFGAPFENVTFSSIDGVKLSGWFVPARVEPNGEYPARGVVILCHGMLHNRVEGLAWAGPIWQRGFALLLFDFRALGRSGGDLCTAGYLETQDLKGAVEYLATRPDMKDVPIGVFGFSMGGATAILAAAEEERIRAVATHGAFATLERAIVQRYRHHFGPLAPFAAQAGLLLGRCLRWFPVPATSVAPINAVSRIAPRPLLLLHGGRDRVVHPADAQDLHDAAGYPKTLHVLPRSGHKKIYRPLRQEARERVADFFCDTLARPRNHSKESPEANA